MTKAFAAAATDLLLEHGPLSLAELHALAVEQGLTKNKHASGLSQYLSDDAYVLRPDGRYDAAARLLRGQVFTTRSRRDERDGVLWSHRDLDALAALSRLPLATGGELRRGASAAESWTGPAGWLPAVGPGEVLALRWDGTALHAAAVADVPGGDSPRAREVREVLGRHARASRRQPYSYSYTYQPRTSLTSVVLSALLEDPGLFSTPVPPLRELLPLPEDLRPQDALGERDPERTATIVEVPLPLRVHEELARRADLLGERLQDYLTLLLGAAADRVVLPAPRYDRYMPYVEEDPSEVVSLSGWRR
jgi:hypothetical protein